jgi:Small metal-binding protein
MLKKILFTIATAFLSTFMFSTFSVAEEEHTASALEHTIAATMGKDAETVKSHASEALKHTGPAKVAHQPHPELVNHIEAAENHLKAAIDMADKGNTASAAKHASEAKFHLVEADK